MKRKQKYFLFIPAFIVYLFFIYSSCSDNPVEPFPPEEQYVKLGTITVSCTEAFIKVSVNDTLLPLNITMNRDNTPVFSFNLTKSDTTIIDTNLSPGSSYNYNVKALINCKEWTGKKLQVQTLPLTSHNFTWQTFTFGDPIFGSSMLYDVAIIDENNIWAVGGIYLDTTGQAYNAVHWDGSNWELKRIMTNACGGVVYPPIQAIFVFSSNDILFAHIDGSISHYNGLEFTNDCSLITQLNGSANKIWGKSRNDFYVVGGNGFIAHYQNGIWSKIESGTDLPINDIWGINYLGETKVLAVASDKYQIRDKKIFSISANTVTEISNAGLPWNLSCIWFNNFYKTYSSGDGLYGKYNTQDYWNRISLPLYYKFSIRGNKLNDIVVCGGLGYVGHYNGGNWINFLGNGLEEISGNYYSLNIKENKICTVGIEDGKAVAVIGTR